MAFPAQGPTTLQLGTPAPSPVAGPSPSPPELARRVAWGKQWGGYYHADKLAGRWATK